MERSVTPGGRPGPSLFGRWRRPCAPAFDQPAGVSGEVARVGRDVHGVGAERLEGDDFERAL